MELNYGTVFYSDLRNGSNIRARNAALVEYQHLKRTACVALLEYRRQQRERLKLSTQIKCTKY